MESQPPPTSQPHYPPHSLPPPQMPPHLAHVVNPPYTLHHPPAQHSLHPHFQSQPPPQHMHISHPSPEEPPHTLPPHTHPHARTLPPMHTIHALPMGYSYTDTNKVMRLEQELEKARHEIDRLRARLADYEKERVKQDSPKVQSRYWTPSEHKRFLEALQKFGPKDVRAIANYVASRNATQVRTHAQKYFLRVAREAKGGALANARKRSMSESDLARVGRSVSTPPGSPMREREKERERPGGGDEIRASNGKPPVPGGIADSTGINLLSLVASERTLEVERR